MLLSIKSSRSAASLMVGFAHGFVFIALGYYLPLYFQATRLVTPTWSGLYLLPLTIGMASAAALTGVAIHKIGHYREFIWAGLVLTIQGCGLLIDLDPNSSIREVMGFGIVAAIGAGLLFDQPLISLQAHVKQDDIATATSTFIFIRNLAMVIAVVAGGAVFDNGMTLQSKILRKAGLPSSLIGRFTGSGAHAHVNEIGKITESVQRDAVKAAYAWSLTNVWIMLMAMASIGLYLSLFIKYSVLSDQHTGTQTGIKKPREEMSL